MVRLLAPLALALVQADPDYEELWRTFKVDFNRNFNGVDDEDHRFSIFKANIDFIEAENAKALDYTLGITQFADWTHDEFKAMAKGVPQGEKRDAGMGVHRWNGQELPLEMNWTARGAVTPVKDQGSCGSCWAFSTTGVLEGANYLTTGKLVSLAEEQILECATQYSQGCGGGFPNDGVKYATENAVCESDAYWPYLRSPGCVANNCSKVGIGYREVVGFVNVPRDSEEDLMSAVAQQPVSVCIEADQSAFQHYKSGIVTTGCGTQLDHAVLAVGYGSDNGKDYWLVKNSWATSWGDNGYIRLARGDGSSKGVCGILDNAMYPVIKTFPASSNKEKLATSQFKEGVALLYQGLDRSLGQNGEVGIYSVDLASAPCCKAELIQRIAGAKPTHHDDRYGFANAATMSAVSPTQAFAVVSNSDKNAVFLEATRSEDGMTATVTMGSKVAYKDHPHAVAGLDSSGKKVALYIREKGVLMFESLKVCIGSVNDDGSFSDKTCEKFQKDIHQSLYLDGHVSTSLWDAARNRLIMIANNCKDGLCWGDSNDHWFPWNNDPAHFSQSIIYASADLSSPQVVQQKLAALPADENRTWYPRKCEVAPSGHYLCLTWSGQKSGFAILNADEFTWSSVQESDIAVHDFAIVDGQGVATDIANGVWTFSDFANPKLTKLGMLTGEGLETRAPVGRLWGFGQRDMAPVTI